MCGVVGYSSETPQKDHYDFLKALIIESKIRGLHSFGYSYFDGTIKTVKEHNIEKIEFPEVGKLIYHNRYATSGDYKNHSNNQPISTDACALVFNGVLDMGTKKEMEKRYSIEMETENDGEIVMQICGSDPAKIQKFIAQTKGSFAGLFLTRDNKIIALRNKQRPLWQLNHSGATFYASTKDIFKRVDKSLEPEELEINKVYQN